METSPEDRPAPQRTSGRQGRQHPSKAAPPQLLLLLMKPRNRTGGRDVGGDTQGTHHPGLAPLKLGNGDMGLAAFTAGAASSGLCQPGSI